MSALLIIGYGAGLGYEAAEELQRHLFDDRDLTILPLHRLTPELASDISRAEQVIFISAAAEGDPVGLSCQKIKAEKVAGDACAQASTPAGLLAVSEALYRGVPPAIHYKLTSPDFHGLLDAIEANRLAIR